MNEEGATVPACEPELGHGEARQSALELADDLSTQGLMLATAESCTGGLIGALLTEIPGSSAFYLGGVISYANAAKTKLLDVERAALEREGAVSETTARQMARGVRRSLDADLSVSVTGIAGPGGGSESKPVGTVWIGIASQRGDRARHHRFDGDRAAVRAASVAAALGMLLEELQALDAGESKP